MCGGDALAVLREEAGTFDASAVRQRQEGLKSEVHARAMTAIETRLNNLLFSVSQYQKPNIPASIAANGATLGSAYDVLRVVKTKGSLGSAFTQQDAVAIEYPARLLERERRIQRPLLEAWRPSGNLLEERLIAFIDSFQHFLAGLRVKPFPPTKAVRLFQLGQMPLCSDQRWIASGEAKVSPMKRDKVIPDARIVADRIGQTHLLAVATELELENAHSDPLLLLNVLLEHIQRHRSCRGNELRARPECWEPATQFGKFAPEHSRRIALDTAYDGRDGHIWPDFSEQMAMIRHGLKVRCKIPAFVLLLHD